MNYRKILLPLLGGFALASLPACAEPLAAQVAKIKREKTRAGLERLLQGLGFTKAELDSLGRGEEQGGNIVDPKYLKRAESFQAELDAEPGPESVTQVFFEGKADEGGDAKRRLYLVMVHKAADKDPKAVDRRAFDLSYCGHSEKGGMTFAFKPVKGAAHKQVVFKLAKVESCGLEASGYDEEDTLRSEQGRWVFKPGPHTGEYESNRGDLPDE